LSCLHHNEGRHAQESVGSGKRETGAAAEDGMGVPAGLLAASNS